jgi:DNA-binding MarR family transcriptional regulator
MTDLDTQLAVRETLRHRAAVHAVKLATTRHLRQNGVEYLEFLLLAVLADHVGGAATPTEIATRLATTTPAVARLVDRCERYDLVHRRRSTDNGRAVEVRLTVLGQRTYEAAAPRFAELTHAALRGEPK